MSNSLSLKKCPFCKNQIPVKSEKCPICKMTLIEHFEMVKQRAQLNSNTQTKNNSNDKTIFSNKAENLLKHYLTKTLDFIKKKRTSFVFALLAIFIVLYFVYIHNSGDSEHTLYNYEIEGDNKVKEKNDFGSKKNNNNAFDFDKPINFDKEKSTSKLEQIPTNNQKTKDFSNIPEKYIPNGKIFSKNKIYFNGLGELTIKNGTTNDAVAKLVSNSINKSVLTIYIRRNSDYTIKKIKDGNYRLYFVVGRHYDVDSSIFLQNCSFAVFEENFIFTTDVYDLKDKIETQYSVFEITLHPIIGGTAKTDAVTKKEFLLL